MSLPKMTAQQVCMASKKLGVGGFTSYLIEYISLDRKYNLSGIIRSSTNVFPALYYTDKQCVNMLEYDDLVWGSFADHFASESKCESNARKIVGGGKPQHTVFCLDKNSKGRLVKDLKNFNVKKGGWIGNPPRAHLDVIELPERLSYYYCENTEDNGVECSYGQGYPQVKVRADIETLREATGDKNCPNSEFYTPYHLQGIG